MWRWLLAAVLAAAPMIASAQLTQAKTIIVKADEDRTARFLPVHVGGKVRKEGLGYSYQWPGVYFETRFKGVSISMSFEDGANNFNVIIDGKPVMILRKPGATTITANIHAGGPHTIRVEKRSETQYATGRFYGFRGVAASPEPNRARQIEFIGDSLTVGYGNTSAFTQCTPDEIFETTDAQEGFGPLTAKHFNADYQINAFSGLGMVRNYDGREHAKYRLPMLYPRALFDDPTPAVQPDWHPQIIVIRIGDNDFSTPVRVDESWGTAEAMAADYQKTYAAFIQNVRAANPTAQILMLYPADDSDYAVNTQKVFEALKASGMARLDSMSLPPMAETGCDGHPNIHDDAKDADALISYFDAHPDDWQGK
jgi:lysophospholipase L1-like esterase